MHVPPANIQFLQLGASAGNGFNGGISDLLVAPQVQGDQVSREKKDDAVTLRSFRHYELIMDYLLDLREFLVKSVGLTYLRSVTSHTC